jgi:hypothetical protein
MLAAPEVRFAFRSGTQICHPGQDLSSALTVLPLPVAMVCPAFLALPLAAAGTKSL